jgi:2-methylcitrate dehydratase PrpD
MSELTRTLAQHLARVTYADLPRGAVLAAKRSLLDAIGVSLGASGLEPACAPFAALAAESGGDGPCSLLGFGRRTTPLMAAFANGALAHALDFEDAYDGAPVHPNAAAVPVALALCEADATIDGPELIAALAAGCDLTCRLGLALQENPDRYGFYPPPILGAFGAAATGAKLLGLSEDQIVAALALTLSQATCSAQFKRDPHSALRAVRDAFAAQAGLNAALLAQLGVRGFEAAIEGEHGLYALYARGAYDPAPLLGELGRRFLGERVSFKPWPSCRGTHAFIEAALSLRAQHAIDPDAIERIDARGAELNLMLVEPEAQKRAPVAAIDAKFSLPFCIALALLRDAIGLDDFAPASLADRRVLALAQRVHFTPEAGTGIREATRGELVLHMRGGATYALRVECPLGHPDHPLDTERLIEKFVDCAGRAARPLHPEAAQVAAQSLLVIEQAGSAQRALAPACAPP